MNAPRGPDEKCMKTVWEIVNQTGNSNRFMVKPPVT
jgi:hypothetical protein